MASASDCPHVDLKAMRMKNPDGTSIIVLVCACGTWWKPAGKNVWSKEPSRYPLK